MGAQILDNTLCGNSAQDLCVTGSSTVCTRDYCDGCLVNNPGANPGCQCPCQYICNDVVDTDGDGIRDDIDPIEVDEERTLVDDHSEWYCYIVSQDGTVSQ